MCDSEIPTGKFMDNGYGIGKNSFNSGSFYTRGESAPQIQNTFNVFKPKQFYRSM